MKHAGAITLKGLENLLNEIRQLTEDTDVKEKKLGIFYQEASAWLHFHEDPAGIFADLKIAGEFVRFSVNTLDEQQNLLDQIKLIGLADRAEKGSSI